MLTDRGAESHPNAYHIPVSRGPVVLKSTANLTKTIILLVLPVSLTVIFVKLSVSRIYFKMDIKSKLGWLAGHCLLCFYFFDFPYYIDVFVIAGQIIAGKITCTIDTKT